MLLPYDPAILLPDMYVPKGIKNRGHIKACMSIFTVANSPQMESPQVHQLVSGDTMGHYHMMEYYSAIKRNRALIDANNMDELWKH